MKKTVIVAVATFLILLTACTPSENINNQNNAEPSGEEIKAVWISVYEYGFAGLDGKLVSKKIDSMFENISALGLNTVFVHMRANADAVYKSDYFPWSEYCTGTQGAVPEYDPLALMTAAAHSKGLKIHAWINPYRISGSTDDVTALCDTHIARQWAADTATADRIITYDGKFYFNPASAEVRTLILNGVREIVDNYDIDGIHFDDYFYPTADESFDSTCYAAYAGTANSPISLSEWRKANISTLVSAVKCITKQAGILFGVSPSAHIDGEYTEKNGYADIENWLCGNGFVDYIVPQIYWGFEYPESDCRFDNMLKKWVSLKRNGSVKLIIGLAAYKAGTEDRSDEWQKNSDILKRQIIALRQAECDGFSMFSYSYLFSSDTANTAERDNLTDILKHR